MGFLLPITPPAISIARFEITSLTFMFVCVPLPVCQMRKGKCALSLPEMTSSAACTMRDRKSTRLNSSHGYISYAVFCLKKKIHTGPDATKPTHELTDAERQHLAELEAEMLAARASAPAEPLPAEDVATAPAITSLVS